MGLAGTSAAGYTGVNQAVGKIWREEGFAAFWKGNGVNIIRIFPYSAGQVIPTEENSLSCYFNRIRAGYAAAGRNLGGLHERERGRETADSSKYILNCIKFDAYFDDGWNVSNWTCTFNLSTFQFGLSTCRYSIGSCTFQFKRKCKYSI